MAKKPYNHTVESQTLNFLSKTGSRNRLRITTGGSRFAGIKPGDRVNISRAGGLFSDVEIVVDPKGNYKVEKNGAIRFPAHKFGLGSADIFTASDTLSKKVEVI